MDTKSGITVELTDDFYIIDMTKDFKRMYELYDEAYFSLLGLRYDHRFSPARMTGGASQYLDKSMELNPIAYWLDAVIMNPFSQAITDMFVKDDANRQKPDTNTLAETPKDNAEVDEQEREKSMTDKGAEFFNKSWITGSVKTDDEKAKKKRGKSWFSSDPKKDEDKDGDKDKSWFPFPKNPDDKDKDKDKDKSWLPDNLLFQEKEEDRLLNQSIDSAFKPPDESTVMPGIGHIKPVELPESPIEEEEEEVPKLVEEKIEEKVEVKAFHIRNTNTNTDIFDHNTNSDAEPVILDGLSLDKIIEERAKNITIETFMTGLTYHEAETILRDIQIQVDHFASLDKPVDIKLSNVFFVNGRFLVLSVKPADNPKMMYNVLRQVLVNTNEPSFNAEWQKIENTELWKKYNKLYENP